MKKRKRKKGFISTNVVNGKVFLGDSLQVMKRLPRSHFHAIITDPPYGLRFMGKSWDYEIPGEPYWSEALEVCRLGAYLLAFGGTRTYHRLACAIEDAGWEIRDCIMWVYGSGFPKSHNLNGDWNGYGTALKSAYEPIIVARKPFGGTVASNVQQHGCGAMNIDECRVGTPGGSPAANRRATARKTGNAPMSDRTLGSNKASVTQAMGKIGRRGLAEVYCEERPSESLGRWPANLIHDGSEEVLEGFPNESHRFFYTPKASKSERGKDNKHPTVKPLKLMEYLLKLICPPGSFVLDPFIGSGSTLVAGLGMNVQFVGIDNDRESFETAIRRINNER